MEGQKFNSELFKERLKALLKERDLTQEQLAEATGISRRTINKYCSGKSARPDSYRIKSLCQVLEVKPSFLLGQTDYQTFEERVQANQPEVWQALEKRGQLINFIDLMGFNTSDFDNVDELFKERENMLNNIESYIDFQCSKILTRKEGNEMMTMNYSELMQQIDTLKEGSFEFCQKMGMKRKRFDDLIQNRKEWTQAEMLKTLEVLGLPADSLQALFFTLA